MKNYLLVGLAGAIGSFVRFTVGTFVHGGWSYSFPLGTFLINLTGCFALGFVTTFLFHTKKLQPSTAAALGTGLIGSFTTFSTFSVETVILMRQAEWMMALTYMFSSMVGGLFLAWAGYKSGQILVGSQKSEIKEGE
ncbi:fluoride efflux transporter CrcB [Rossellomorea aquimaris]|uniref:fluoride efflux transporter CrcB n=1 Tax=Rossellomorea aquimaris TaxID=189382 RepID=UPI001CD642F8|nr:fluoride efflux transporter CrcB [Rossellomorea aquimaris]MCA1053719.1 fluoride efflux transporter CrcB [Rossellomorea aquimaris]